MRIDNPEFHALNISEITARQAILEVWFTDDPADLVYLTSHANTDTPDGATVIPNVMIAAPVVSQTLQPTEFHSTNGGGNYEILDREGLITAKIREMNEAGKSLAGKTIRLRATFEGLAFENSVVVATHQFERLEQDGLSYTFVCLDVQRSAQKDEIFDPVSTILTSNVSATDNVIPVSSTSRFSTVWHGPSYSAEANQDVGYLWIKSGEKVEIVAWTGKTATSFTGCIRGRFGTIPQDWEALDSEGESNELEVVEFIYLELPVAKLAYAVLTGNLYGDTGKHLPAHWTPDISEAWVDTASFTSIGSDIWNPADDTAGKVCFFAGLQKISAKKFIYTELLPLIGCYLWITENGEIALRRITDILSSAAHVVELNESNVVSTGAAAYRHNEVTNYLRVDWSYDPIKKSFLRTSSFIDDESATKYPDAKQRKLEFKGLHGSRHSRDAIRHTFAVMRDQLSSEPIYLTVEGFPALNTLQVGDIVRGNWQHLPDYTDTANLNRAFEVRAVSCDWLNGAFPTLQLFGTTRKASANPDDDPDGVGIGHGIPDAFYDEGGVDIETAFPGAVTRVGSLVTLTSDITFTGPNALTNSDGSLNSAAILRVNGDFQVADGVTLSWTRNLALKVKGFFQCNGLLDGVAGGGAGGDYRRTYQNQQVTLSTAYLWNGTYLAPVRLTGYNATYAPPEPGYVHAGMYGQGPVVVRIRDLVDSGYIPEYTVGSGQIEVGDPVGRNVVSYSLSGLPSVPSLDLDGTVRGLPSTLIGGGGPAGGHVYTYGYPSNSSPYTAVARAHGTSGGAGGAGLVTISRGMSFGPNGRIDTSGGDAATDAGTYTLDMEGPGDEVVRAGRGCGGSPGSWYCVIDGADSTAPLVSALNFWAFYGDGDSIGNPRAPARFNWYQHQTGNDHASNILSVSQQIGGANLWESMHRVQFIVESVAAPGELTPIDEIPPAPTAIGLTESVNVPATPAGNLSTIAALVTPPSPLGSYSHAWVEWRYAGATAWNRVPVAAENETTFTVQANGATVQARAIAVSTTGVERTDGPVSSITVTNVGVNTDYAFEFGFDPVTETYFRVIDNDSGDTVVGLSGGGLAGKVAAGEGSTGYVHLGDKPTSLSGINAGEGAKLAGIATGATVNHVYRQASAPASGMVAGDLWIETDNGNRLYYYSGSTWVDSRDAGIAEAIADAAEALGVAEAGITSYFQTTAPTSGMSAGDLWFDTDAGNAPYRYSGSAWVSARDTGIAQALQDAADAQSTADGKIVTFIQSGTPTAQSVGDLWYNTTTRTVTRWSGSAWVSFATYGSTWADVTGSGKPADNATVNHIYRQASAPASGMVAGDLWLDTDDNNRLYYYSGSAWVDSRDAGIAQALANAAAAQTTANAKIRSYYQASAPASGMVSGDLWFDTDDGNKQYRYSGSAWVEIQDDAIATALNAAADAQSTADGKVVTFIQTATPTAEGVGDLWYNTTDRVVRRWSGSAWVSFSTYGSTWTDVTGSGKPADNATVNHVYQQATAPSSGMVSGDVWFDTDDGNKPYRYSGSAWVAVRDTGATQEALDAEVVTTGGVVLSTDGAVRTAGKTSVDDAVEGVYLGDEGGDAAFYAGDGALDYIRYKEGVGLQIGPSVKIEGLGTAFNGDFEIKNPRWDPDTVTLVNVGGCTASLNGYRATLAVGDSAANNSWCNIVSVYNSSYTLYPIAWDRPYIFAVRVRLSGVFANNVKFFAGLGSWVYTPGSNHVGFMLNSAGIHLATGVTGSYSETLLRSALVNFESVTLLLRGDGAGTVQAYIDGTLVATVTSNVPTSGTVGNFPLFRANTGALIPLGVSLEIGEWQLWMGR